VDEISNGALVVLMGHGIDGRNARIEPRLLPLPQMYHGNDGNLTLGAQNTDS
jgi:hypothetical protein